MITMIVLHLRNLFVGEQDIRAIKTERRISSEALLRTKERQFMESSLVEKAIEVEGVLKEVTFKHDKFSLILEGGYKDKLIICELKNDQSEAIKNLKKGTIVTVKGILKGYLKDAILLQCIIIDKSI
ncbi:hypothetical protein ABN763_07680 [Spongiivirga sp. MCCC 1A20706]